MALEELIKVYLEFVAAKNTETTLNMYRDRLNRLKRFAGVRRVTKELIREWQQSMLSEPGLSHNTVYQTIAAARRMYAWLVENEMMANNPVGKCRDLTIAKVDRPVITAEEHARIVFEADRHEDDDVWPYAVRCGWETGLRLSDVSLLDWKDILWNEQGLRATPLKTKRFRKVVEIPASPKLMLFFKKEWERQGCPLQGSISPMMSARYRANHRLVSSAFVELAAKANVCKSYHCYRHGFISRCIASGVSPAVVATMSGQTIKQVMEYVHLSLDEKRSAMAAMTIGTERLPECVHGTNVSIVTSNRQTSTP